MKVIIFGDGGHSKVIRNIITSSSNMKVISVLDDKYDVGFEKEGIIHTHASALMTLLAEDVKLIIAIGNNKTRKKIVEQLGLSNEFYVSLIHPTAIISPTARIGIGTVVMPRAVVNAEAIIGNHSIINTGAIIEHENQIGNFAHISPNATLTGNVTVGEGAHVCATVTIIPGKRIGNWSIVGAGSTVIHDIPNHCKAVGSPTRIIEEIPH